MRPIKHRTLAALPCLFALCIALPAQQNAPPADTQPAPPQVIEHENGIATSTAASTVAASTVSASQVRIVRLSQVIGKVQMDRHNSSGFEATFANLPIVQGARLKTGVGLAEVEFEDNSSLRLAPDSLIDFNRLGRETSGATVNSFNLTQGTLYLSLTGTKGNDFTIATAGEQMTLAPASHVRLDVYPAGSELKVFKGAVTVTDSTGAYTVEKGRTFRFGGTQPTPPVIVKSDEPGLYDKWDKQSVDYHSARLNVASFGGTGQYQYGLNDMNYYGSFNNVAGCGQVWQPFFTSAGWSPYASGIWALYPGAGYSFVSPYPWAWTPYHSGNWVSCGGAGWGWQPGNGNSWTGLNNIRTSAIVKPIAPHGPVLHQPSLVAVGSVNMHVSRVGDSQKFEFARDSAGLGVPRSTFGNLNKLSQQVATRGSATTGIRADAAATAFATRLVAGQTTDARQPASRNAIYNPNLNGSSNARSQTAAAPLSRPVAVHAANPGIPGVSNLGGMMASSGAARTSAPATHSSAPPPPPSSHGAPK